MTAPDDATRRPSAPRAIDSTPRAIYSSPRAIDSAPRDIESTPRAAEPAHSASQPAPHATSLDQVAKGYSATIAELRPPDGQAMADHLERLMELGFLPGETVRVLAKGMPSGEPIAVRIGQATFALRRFEAEWIRVRTPRRAET